MNPVFALLAPLALLLPMAPQDDSAALDGASAALDPNTAEKMASEKASDSDRTMLDAAYRVPTQNQVRIERRVTIRIAPRTPTARQSLMADLPQDALPQRFVERKMENCVPISNIAGVQTGSGNRLLLYLRDRRVVSAALEKSCRARDFYSGFYLERNKDGMLCVDRDKLQSRTGANCEVDRLRHMVPASD